MMITMTRAKFGGKMPELSSRLGHLLISWVKNYKITLIHEASTFELKGSR